MRNCIDNKEILSDAESGFTDTTLIMEVNNYQQPTCIDNALQKAVSGFYHINSHKYIINDIIKLSIKYLLILDEFSNNVISENILIRGGIHNNICQYISNDKKYVTVFGKNIVSLSNIKEHNYHHWQFKVLPENVESSSTQQTTFIVGIDKKENKNNSITYCTSFGYVGSDGFIEHFVKKHSILDMYLNLNELVFESKLTLMVNNEFVDIQYIDVDDTICYRMAVSLSGKQSIELISYHHSKIYDINNNNDAFNIAGFSHSISDIVEKKKLIQHALKMHPNVNEWQNDYIDCLVIQQEFKKAYDFIIKHNMKHIRHHNIVAIGNFFYEEEDYWYIPEALEMYTYIENDEILIEYDLCYQIAYCYNKTNYKKDSSISKLAIKYYNLCLKYEKNMIEEKIVKCTVNIGNTYCRLREYKNALDYYLKLKESDISSRNLEQRIAFCYEMEKDYDNALIWYTKCKNEEEMADIFVKTNDYQNALLYYLKLNEKHIGSMYKAKEIAFCYEMQKDYNNAFVWYTKCEDEQKITDLLGMMDDVEKIQEYYNDALNSDKGKNDFYIRYSYASFLYRSTKQYEKSIIHYNKALEIFPISYGEKEKCHIALGMVFYKLGDFDKAVDHTKNALFFDAESVASLNNLGYFYLMANKYELSYKYLIKCIENDPEYDLTNGYLGNCLYGMKKYDEAIIYLKKSLTKENDLNHPNVGPMILDNYANILFMKNEYIESIKICKQLIEREEFAKHTNKDKIYYLISLNYVKLLCEGIEISENTDQCNLNEAFKYALKAVAIKPNTLQYTTNVNDIKQKMNI